MGGGKGQGGEAKLIVQPQEIRNLARTSGLDQRACCLQV
jgi:hypothetical protein